MGGKRLAPIEPGERFGLLVVRRELPDRLQVGASLHRAYECKCDCGATTAATIYDLRGGRRVSCGCRRRGSKSGPGSKERLATGFSLGTYYSSLKKRAAAKGHTVEISREEHDDVVTKPCAFCGSTERVGVDRIDSALGYVPGNVQPLCWDCNRAKSSRDDDEFLAWVTRVYQHRVVGVRQ